MESLNKKGESAKPYVVPDFRYDMQFDGYLIEHMMFVELFLNTRTGFELSIDDFSGSPSEKQHQLGEAVRKSVGYPEIIPANVPHVTTLSQELALI